MKRTACDGAAAALAVMLAGCNGEPARTPAGVVDVPPPSATASSNASPAGPESASPPVDAGAQAAAVATSVPRAAWPASCEGDHVDGWTAGNRCMCSDQGAAIGVSLPSVDCPAAPPGPSALTVSLSTVGSVRSGQDLAVQIVVTNRGAAPVVFRVARTGATDLAAVNFGLLAVDPQGKNVPEDAGTCGGFGRRSDPVTSSAGVTLPPGGDVTWRVTWRARVHVKSGGVETRLAQPSKWGETSESPCHESDVPLAPGIYRLQAHAPVIPGSFASQLGTASATVTVTQ
jgi:hypothetical protein